jgi:pimeloyl-ACP methyl ester carboxylesterase
MGKAGSLALCRNRGGMGYAETPITFKFATHMTREGAQDLYADLYHAPGNAPSDLIVWMHSGGFRTGSRRSATHGKIAMAFNQDGYSIAYIDYRRGRPKAVPSPSSLAVLPDLEADARAAGIDWNPNFYGFRAIAVVEDCCAFLRHAEANCAALGLTGRFIVAGSSAGAISALNTLYLSDVIGQARPDIATVFCFSGGFAYPSYLRPTGARILALHGPQDGRVPISSIRRFQKETPDLCLLIEDAGYSHGALALNSDQRLEVAIGRCMAFDRTPLPPLT